MPESITIAAFVFGAVLILLSLAGGKIKLFGAEIQERVGTPARIAAFMLGAALLSYGLLRDVLPQPGPQPEPSPALTLKLEPAAPSPSPSPAAPQTPLIDISGTWHDANGVVYQFTQDGNSYRFVGANQLTGYVSQGSGTIDGLRVNATFQTNIPSTGSASGSISADGKYITGTVKDSSQFDVYVLTLYR